MTTIVTFGLFIGSILMGCVLTKLGKPYNTTLFTIHKIVALGYCVMVGLLIKDQLIAESTNSVFLATIILLIISVLTLFASGAMMSIGLSKNKSLQVTHLLGTISLVISNGMLLVITL